MSSIAHLIEEVMTICQVPHEFKVPLFLAMASSATSVDLASIENEYHQASHQQYQAVTGPGQHPMGWILFQWLLHWHPDHSGPGNIKVQIPSTLQRAFMRWHNHGPHAKAHSFMQIMPQHLGLHPCWGVEMYMNSRASAHD